MIHLNLTSGLVEEITEEIVYSLLGEPEISFSKNKISKKEQNEILGVYRHRPGFVARSRPIRTYGRIQITNKNDNIYIQSRRGPWRDSLQIFK